MSPGRRFGSVAVLGGGPDGEREVSIRSATAIAQALRTADPALRVTLHIIDRLPAAGLSDIDAEALFPYLHGPYGEGGPLQDALAADGRPFVGSGPRAARLAMDKLATKLLAAGIGLSTPRAAVLNPRDAGPPVQTPVVVKPVHEGSTLGLRLCPTAEAYSAALGDIARQRQAGLSPERTYMVESMVPGREITVGVTGRPGQEQALPIIEIIPREGLYDFDAKYTRSDTRYVPGPSLPGDAAHRAQRAAVDLHRALGCRHVSRSDFIIDAAGTPWLLEINTTPGMTDHSLVPKAAAHAGVGMPALCLGLLGMAEPA